MNRISIDITPAQFDEIIKQYEADDDCIPKVISALERLRYYKPETIIKVESPMGLLTFTAKDINAYQSVDGCVVIDAE